MASKFFTIIKNISVEPALTLAAVSSHIFMVTMQVGLIRVLCEKRLQNGDPRMYNEHKNETVVQCWSPNFGLDSNHSELLQTWSSVEIDLQRQASSWFMAFSLAYMVPCIFSDIFLGAYSDKQGRKYNIIIGFLGMSMLLVCWSILLAWPASVSIWIAVLGNFIGGLAGYVYIIIISSAAYIADTVADKNALTMRMTILEFCAGFSGIIGPMIAKECLVIMTFSQTMLIGFGLLILAAIYSSLRLKQIPPKKMRRIAQIKGSGKRGKLQSPSPKFQPPVQIYETLSKQTSV